VLFLPAPPLKYVGVDAYRKSTEAWLSGWQGPLEYEFTDVHITAGDDVAVWHSLNHMSGTTTNGKKSEAWMRATVCFNKIDGRWLVTHEHVSVPFDMKSGQALMDLKP
jgi:ketosteroid isomerase-like protein